MFRDRVNQSKNIIFCYGTRWFLGTVDHAIAAEVFVISDSPYSPEGTILKPLQGFVAGVGAALLMLGVLFILQSLSGVSVVDALERFGIIVLSGTEAAKKLAIAGTIIHALLGGLFGLLYAVCQVSIPKKGLIGVGISYGVVLWALASLCTHWLYRDTLGQVIHTWAWLVASVVFGLCLAQVAIWVEQQRPTRECSVPVD